MRHHPAGPRWSAPAEQACFVGRQGTALAAAAGSLWLFGGRVAGKGREYVDDLWMRPLGVETQPWTQCPPTAPWPSARHNHCLVPVRGGTALLLHGGAQHGALEGRHYVQEYCASVWIYDLATGHWAEHPPLQPAPSGRHCHSLVAWPGNDDTLVLFGGYDGHAYCNDVWLLHVPTLTWRRLPDDVAPPSPRSQHAACVMDDHLWVFGGYWYDAASKCEVYYNDLYALPLHSQQPGSWVRVRAANAPHRRNRGSLFVVRQRLWLVNGNYYDNRRGTDQWFTDCHELCEALGSHPHWVLHEAAGAAPPQSHLAHAVVESEGCVYLFGGEKDGARARSLHVFVAPP